MITVELINDIDYTKAPTLADFQRWVDTTIAYIPNKIPETAHEICISIVDTETSASLNETYRHKNGPTNVLSFPYEPMPGIAMESIGDLAICAEVMEAESKEQQKSPESHWAHLTVHGVLHLLGYDHIIDSDATIMESLEIKILKQLGFEDPYT